MPEKITLAKGAEFINRYSHGSQAISIQTRVRIEELDPQKREGVLGRKNIHCSHQELREVATPNTSVCSISLGLIPHQLSTLLCNSSILLPQYFNQVVSSFKLQNIWYSSYVLCVYGNNLRCVPQVLASKNDAYVNTVLLIPATCVVSCVFKTLDKHH